MALTLLAVTGDPGLLEEIRTCQSQIEDSELVTISTKTEALELASSRYFDAVIINAGENDMPLVRFARELVTEHGNIRLLVIPPDNNLRHPVLKGLVFSGLILRPLEVAALRVGLGFDSNLKFDEITDEIHSGLETLQPPILSDVDGSPDSSREVEIPDWLEDIEMGKYSADADGPIAENSDLNELTGCWEREEDKLNEIPPPLPGLRKEKFSEETSPTRAENNSTILNDVNTALTTKLDQKVPDQVVQDAGETQEINLDWNKDEELPIEQSNPANAGLESQSEDLLEETEIPSPAIETSPESSADTTPLGIHSVRFPYTVVLIPKLSTHFLARDLSDRLGFILPQIHLMHGWKLTGLSIRPTYILWQFNLPASVSPLDAVAEIRKKTSIHIFINFPQLAAENLSSDFWAPGYLVLSGNQPPTPPTIREFIQRTRQIN